MEPKYLKIYASSSSFSSPFQFSFQNLTKVRSSLEVWFFFWIFMFWLLCSVVYELNIFVSSSHSNHFLSIYGFVLNIILGLYMTWIWIILTKWIRVFIYVCIYCLNMGIIASNLRIRVFGLVDFNKSVAYVVFE